MTTILGCDITAKLENETISERLNIGMLELIEMNAVIMDKMKVRDRNQAALRAMRDGLILVENIHELQEKL